MINVRGGLHLFSGILIFNLLTPCQSHTIVNQFLAGLAVIVASLVGLFPCRKTFEVFRGVFRRIHIWTEFVRLQNHLKTDIPHCLVVRFLIHCREYCKGVFVCTLRSLILRIHFWQSQNAWSKLVLCGRSSLPEQQFSSPVRIVMAICFRVLVPLAWSSSHRGHK